MIKFYLTSLTLVIMLVGCAHIKPAVVIQTFDVKDMFIVPAGATVHIPKGSHAEYHDAKGVLKAVKDWTVDTDITVDKNGRFMSDFLLKDIVNTDTP